MVRHHQLYGTGEAASTSPRPTELAGLIMWLPPRRTTNVSLDRGVYNHPVVILSPSLRPDGQVDFLVVCRVESTQDFFNPPL